MATLSTHLGERSEIILNHNLSVSQPCEWQENYLVSFRHLVQVMKLVSWVLALNPAESPFLKGNKHTENRCLILLLLPIE